MDYPNEVLKAFREHEDVVRATVEQVQYIARAVELVVDTLRAGNRLLLAGNGGSAADAQHWAAEWVIRMDAAIQRPGLPALSLSTDSSILTAGANDIGFDRVFARQVEALGSSGDLLIVISTSGNSPNLVEAIAAARGKSMAVLGILGKGGGRIAPLCDLPLIVPSEDTQRIQEMHAVIGHLLCGLSERALYTEQ
ncbi:SIS domain-containing protein [bacterium]|nr:SIS domain-containing protein [bacterium]